MTTRIDDIIEFRKKLLDWYYKNGRHFPWRNKSISNYQKIIAEVLLQRTKAETVAKFFPKFIKQYPSWKFIANSELEELEKALKPIGLHKQRATRLYKLAAAMSSKGGRIPYNYQELEKIPMFGQYIANAAMSVVHDEPYPLLDVNMARVLERYFGPRKLADIRYDPYLQELAFKLVATRDSKIVNWAVLDFAAMVCKARKPNCDICPFVKECHFVNSQTPH
jgi:A/G-specific adenine glycosylase